MVKSMSQSLMSENAIKPVILCVDDTPTNLSLLNHLLSERYMVRLVNSGQGALQYFERFTADLILLDVMMPEINGYDVCRELKLNPITRHIPVLFLTAKNTPEDEEEALSAGGLDFINKPINPKVLFARIETHLALKAYHDLLRTENQQLEQVITEKLSDIFRLQDASLAVMISLAEFRDECTGNHIKRTQQYIHALAKEVSESIPEYAMDEQTILLIHKCAPLHDIGKITTPDHILLKAGHLTADEFSIMKMHAQKGYDILAAAASTMGDYGDFLTMAQQIALTHHEKWDGSGYPRGLSGQDIPLAGRLMAIVDVYDALRSVRPYKQALSHVEALEVMRASSGQHFEPILLAAFIRIADEVAHINDLYRD